MKKWIIIKSVGALIGIGFLIYILGRINLMQILQKVVELKWWLVPIMINSFLWYLMYTEAWRRYFSNLKHSIPFLHLLKIKICGEAVNFMTPLGFIAGDPVRVLMLEKHLGQSTRMGSVIVDRILHSLASVVFVFAGIVLALFYIGDLIGRFRWLLFIFYLTIIILLSFLVLELVRGKGVRSFHSVFVRTGLAKRFPTLDARMVALNHELSDFAGGGIASLVTAFFLHLGGRILGAVEIAIIFFYFEGHFNPVFSVILATLTTVIHLLFSFVPGGIGLIESLYGGFFYYEGRGLELGVSMQLIRRLRSTLWFFIAVSLLYRPGSGIQSLLKPQQKKPDEIA